MVNQGAVCACSPELQLPRRCRAKTERIDVRVLKEKRSERTARERVTRELQHSTRTPTYHKRADKIWTRLSVSDRNGVQVIDPLLRSDNRRRMCGGGWNLKGMSGHQGGVFVLLPVPNPKDVDGSDR